MKSASTQTLSSGLDNVDRPLPWLTTKDLLWALYLYPVRLLSRLSLPALNLLQRVAEPVFQLLAARGRREVLEHLSRAFGPGTPPSALESIAHRFVANAVRQSGDDLMLLRGDVPVRCRSFQGREHLDAALAGGKGVMLVSLHWYAGRAAKRCLAETGYPVMTVRNQVTRDRSISRFGRRVLQPRYIRLLHEVIRDEVFRQDPEVSLKILGRLRSGGMVDIHLDTLALRHVVESAFLGRIRRFPAGALHLARAARCPVLTLFSRGHGGDLEIRIDPPLPLDYSLPVDAFCEAHLPPLVRILESHVLEHPDQWELWTKL